MPKIRKKSWGSFFPEYELQRRETGFRCNIGWESNLKYALYSSLHPCNSWDPDPNFSCAKRNGGTWTDHGGIFNLEFSPDGKQLVSACEKKALMIFDPLTRRQICDVGNAHISCVNGIKFLDNRVFATCSDDKTVALWDVRNMRRNIVRLYGHDNWVKNIEYSSEDEMLVTSGFDGKILGWNINRYTEDSVESSELFSMQGLMRIRLTPDLTKLVICTIGGYMIVVHNLCLKSLAADLKDFEPDMYRLMQLSNANLPLTAHCTKLFYSKRNRVEFISDFPPSNDAGVIHSLQIHPQGWCALSRNTSTGDSSEWTCVHDIQEQETEKEAEDLHEDTSLDTDPDDSSDATSESNPFYVNTSGSSPAPGTSQDANSNLRLAFTITPRMEVMLRQMRSLDELQEEEEEERRRRDDERRGDDEQRGDDERRGDDTEPTDNFSDTRYDVQRPFFSMNVYEALERIESRRRGGGMSATAPAPEENDSLRSDASDQWGRSSQESHNRQDFRLRRRRDTGRSRDNAGDRSVFFIRPRRRSSANRPILVVPAWHSYIRTRDDTKNQRIARNSPRLLNYIEEPNKGKGFIKELCFSYDGRLICSPFDCGVRLLMFDEKCSELSHCVQKVPQQLCALSNNICHTKCVVSTKFSPTDCLLVSGCLNGKIVWHQPIL